MSNGYDFFGGAATTPRDAAPVGFARPAWSPPPAKPSRSLPLAVGGIVLAAAVAAGALYYLDRGHPISLPATAGGLAELTTLTSAEKAAIKDGEKAMANRAHVHDVSSRFYGRDGGQAFFVIAGRVNGAETNMQDAEAQFAAAAAGTNTGLSTGTMSSGGDDYECLWSPANGDSYSVCFWWSGRALLVGEGVRFGPQSTADALAGVKAYAGLS